MSIELLTLAAVKATKYHEGQVRKFSRDSYVSHCFRVSAMLAEYTLDDRIIAAGLLHDTIEGTEATGQLLRGIFGEVISSLVMEVTNDNSEIACIGKMYYMSSKINNLSQDALSIKLVDRIDNILDLSNPGTPKQFIDRYIHETDFILSNFNNELSHINTALLCNLRFATNYIAISKQGIKQ